MYACIRADGQMNRWMVLWFVSISRFTIAISDKTALFLVLAQRCLEPDDGALLNMRQAHNGNFYSKEQLLTHYGILGETMWNEFSPLSTSTVLHQSPQLRSAVLQSLQGMIIV